MKIFKIVLIATLIGLASNLFAQDAQHPYQDSEHTYLVTMEDGTNNTPSWIVADASGNPLAAQPTADMNATVTGNEAKLVITWNKDWASISPDGNPNFTIQFKESKPAGGCISVRSADITVKGNTFFLIAGDNANECHDEDNHILAQGASATTTVQFTVTLDDVTYALPVDTWEFDFTLAKTSVDYSIDNVTVNGVSGVTDYNGISIPGNKKSVTIEVELSGPVAIAQSVTLEISDGKAKIGSIVTPDNGTGNKEQMLTIDALPNTSNIRFN